MVIEEVRAIFAPFLDLTFFDPISSFAAKDYWKFEENVPTVGLIIWLFVPQSDQIKKNLKAIPIYTVSRKKVPPICLL